MTVIRCQNVTKSYGRNKILNNISFQIDKNKITGVIGPNGVGKTTLLRIIAGYIKKTSGEIKVFSEDPFQSLTVSANTIFISDQMMLPPTLTLSEIIKSSSQFYQNFDIDLAQKLFDYFPLKKVQYYDKLSKGMRSTFQAIIEIAARCPLTIFDEPTTGMDTGVRKDFYRALLKDYIAHPRTILISSHYLNEMEDLLEDVLVLKEGKIRLHLSISEMKEWAIGFRGDETTLHKWIKDNKILHTQEIGKYEKYVVLKNDFSEEQLYQARQDGINISFVSPSDLSVYLTDENRGGIDHVFQ